MGDEDHQLQYKIFAPMQYLSIYTKVSGGFEDGALVMPQQQNGRMVYLVVRVRALQSQVCGFKSWSLPMLLVEVSSPHIVPTNTGQR